MTLPPVDDFTMFYYGRPSPKAAAMQHLNQLYEACERYERGPSRKRTKAWNRYLHWIGKYDSQGLLDGHLRGCT